MVVLSHIYCISAHYFRNDLGVCLPVCHMGGLCKTAEEVHILFWVELPRDERYSVSDGGSHLPGQEDEV